MRKKACYPGDTKLITNSPLDPWTPGGPEKPGIPWKRKPQDLRYKKKKEWTFRSLGKLYTYLT